MLPTTRKGDEKRQLAIIPSRTGKVAAHTPYGVFFQHILLYIAKEMYKTLEIDSRRTRGEYWYKSSFDNTKDCF